MSKPSLMDHLKSGFRLLSKYSLTSLTATGVDFMAFHVALTSFVVSAVQATVLGRCMGAIVSFWMQRRWVFQTVQATRWQVLVVRYGGGVFLGMGMNVGGVWLLHDVATWPPWPARITAAVAGWLLIFLFNHRFVFKPESNQQPFNYRT